MNSATDSATPAKAVSVSGFRRRQRDSAGAETADEFEGAGLSMAFRRYFHSDHANIIVEHAAGGELTDFGDEFVEELRGGYCDPLLHVCDQAGPSELVAARISHLV